MSATYYAHPFVSGMADTLGQQMHDAALRGGLVPADDLNDKVHIVKMFLADAIERKVLPQLLSVYGANYAGASDFLFEGWAIRQSAATRVEEKTIRTNAEPFAMTVRNTTARAITYTVDSFAGTVEFEHLAIQYDAYAISNVDKALFEFDAKLIAVFADLVAKNVLMAISAIVSSPSVYSQALRFVGRSSGDLDAAWDRMARQTGEINKSEFALTDILSRLAAVMPRAPTRLIASRDSSLFISGGNDANLDFLKSGEGMLRAPTLVPSTAQGVKLMAFPVVEPHAASPDVTHGALRHLRRNVSVIPFFDRRGKAADFKYTDRSVEVYTHKCGYWEAIHFGDMLKAVPYFEADGKLNVGLLTDLAKDCETNIREASGGRRDTSARPRPFDLCGTEPHAAIDSCQLLVRVKDAPGVAGGKDPMYLPCLLAGALPRHVIRDELFAALYEQAEQFLWGKSKDIKFFIARVKQLSPGHLLVGTSGAVLAWASAVLASLNTAYNAILTSHNEIKSAGTITKTTIGPTVSAKIIDAVAKSKTAIDAFATLIAATSGIDATLKQEATDWKDDALSIQTIFGGLSAKTNKDAAPAVYSAAYDVTSQNRFLNDVRANYFSLQTNIGSGGGSGQPLAETLENVTDLTKAIGFITDAIDAIKGAFPNPEKAILKAIIGTTYEGRQMEVFKERVTAALALSPTRRLAALFILLHRPDAVEIERMMRVGRINSYLGVVGLRLEMRYYDSMIAVADRPDGTFGIYQTPHSDINVFEPKHVYDPERKQGSVTFESRGGFLVTTDDALCPLIAVKGAHIPEGCGGYGAKPFDQRTYAAPGTGKDTFIKNQIKSGHSIFAALTSTNSLVDGTFPTVLSINGVFCASQFSQHLDAHAEFGINRQKVMWPGVTMLMYAVPELYTYRADRDDPKHRPRKMSLQELAAAARYNTAGATCSIRHATALAPHAAVAPARHVDGAMLPGWRERGMSLANVGSVPAGDLLGRVGLARSDLYLDPAMVSGAKRLRIGMD